VKNILIIGGTGFLGSAIAGELVRRATNTNDGGECINLTLPTRRRERAKHLLVLPTARVVEADVHDPAVLAGLMRGQDAVISLVGILRGDFQRSHADLPARIAEAAKAAGVRRIVHVSALKAGADAPSDYLRSKAAGEAALRASGLDVTILRPSVIFGRGDSFLTLFAGLAALAPFFPLACADARFQPVWVGDVAAVVADSLERSESIGKTYDVGGPKVYALRELVAYAARISGHPRVVIGLPHAIGWLQAWVMEFVPNGPMTRDNIRSMQIDSVCEADGGLAFGRTATPLEAVAPGYL